jgi:hypothetical protein
LKRLVCRVITAREGSAITLAALACRTAAATPTAAFGARSTFTRAGVAFMRYTRSRRWYGIPGKDGRWSALHFRRARAFLHFLAHLVYQVFAQLVVRGAELLPPVGQDLVHLANVSTQTHKVKGGAKALLLDQAKGRAAHALLKARLHHPDLAHVPGQLAPA